MFLSYFILSYAILHHCHAHFLAACFSLTGDCTGRFFDELLATGIALSTFSAAALLADTGPLAGAALISADLVTS